MQILSLSPRGKAAQGRQVVARRDQAAANFVNPKASAPLAVSHIDAQAAKGSACGTSDRERIFEFDNEPPPDVGYAVNRFSRYNSNSGDLLMGTTSYRFDSG